MKSRNTIVFLVICSLLLVIAVGIWFRLGPKWQLSLSRENDKTIFTITTTKSPKPIYEVRTKGTLNLIPFTKLTRNEIEMDKSRNVKTLFYDDTLQPGRWTVQIENIKLDIMPAYIVVNEQFECNPGEYIELDKDGHIHK